jgi:uncharacterized protein (DUF1697 family)
MGKGASRYVALMRGVNVGGKNMLPMKELAAMFAKARCEDVTTYIQSGNVIFSAGGGVARELAELMALQVEERFGFRVPVILRTAAELKETIENNPFLKAGVPKDMLHVYFLAGVPKAEDVAALDPARSAPDEFVVVGRDVFARLPNGTARTKLTNAYFDSKLRTVSTVRNWRTVLKLAELITS